MHSAFAVHMLNDAGKQKAKHIAEGFDVLVDWLNRVCPPGRNASIMITKLEEACFFAKKAMAEQQENQQE
jgi:hypothetical protein